MKISLSAASKSSPQVLEKLFRVLLSKIKAHPDGYIEAHDSAFKDAARDAQNLLTPILGKKKISSVGFGDDGADGGVYINYKEGRTINALYIFSPGEYTNLARRLAVKGAKSRAMAYVDSLSQEGPLLGDPDPLSNIATGKSIGQALTALSLN